MVVNFRIRKISQDTRKVTRTPMLIKKIQSPMNYKNLKNKNQSSLRL
jgi:hypothetical protein